MAALQVSIKVPSLFSCEQVAMGVWSEGECMAFEEVKGTVLMGSIFTIACLWLPCSATQLMESLNFYFYIPLSSRSYVALFHTDCLRDLAFRTAALSLGMIPACRVPYGTLECQDPALYLCVPSYKTGRCPGSKFSKP